MHDKVVFHPIKSEQLTRIQKHRALRVLMFLKQKRYGKIKGCVIADGRKQRAVSKKSDATSPTTSIVSVLVTAAIDATEVRDVAVIDASRAFLTDDMDEELILILEN